MIVWCDRDGTLIHQEGGKYVLTPDDLVMLPGAAASIALLQNAGLTFCVVTNQSGISEGLLQLSQYQPIHEKMEDAVKEAGGKRFKAFVCPHRKEDHCDCRKPRSGLLHYAAGWHQQDPMQGWMIGDFWSDIIAAKNISFDIKAILVETGRGKDEENEKWFRRYGIYPDYTEPNILIAAYRLLDSLGFRLDTEYGNVPNACKI